MDAIALASMLVLVWARVVAWVVWIFAGILRGCRLKGGGPFGKWAVLELARVAATTRPCAINRFGVPESARAPGSPDVA